MPQGLQSSKRLTGCSTDPHSNFDTRYIIFTIQSFIKKPLTNWYAAGTSTWDSYAVFEAGNGLTDCKFQVRWLARDSVLKPTVNLHSIWRLDDRYLWLIVPVKSTHHLGSERALSWITTQDNRSAYRDIANPNVSENSGFVQLIFNIMPMSGWIWEVVELFGQQSIGGEPSITHSTTSLTLSNSLVFKSVNTHQTFHPPSWYVPG